MSGELSLILDTESYKIIYFPLLTMQTLYCVGATYFYV